MAGKKGLIAAAAMAIGVIGFPGMAIAYPQWQFSSGSTRCAQCHFNPAGGGLINNYGRDAVGEDLSSAEGSGAFLHGAVELPGWLALGGDFRGAFLSHDAGNAEGPRNVFFPMQADLMARARFQSAFSVTATVGYRGQARGDDLGEVFDGARPAVASRFISREHYAMWRPKPLGLYARAGRFFAPFGLRLAEHTTYVRRDLGYNLQDETYNLSGGMVQEEWEAHVTAFLPDLTGVGSQERGLAAMGEYRFHQIAAAGVSVRGASEMQSLALNSATDARRLTGGLFGKYYLAPAKTLIMAELDLTNVTTTSLTVGQSFSSNRMTGYLGATLFPVRGWWASMYFEVSQTDIKVKGTATTAVNGQLNWFPYPHLEMIILGRVQAPHGTESAKSLLIQLHYFL
jgi:hypothetical protein